ncbi:MAG TPA: chemotaxis protein CheB [Flavisolibacter sp.]|nr:chemotaxis protein CheB [Flavisolibacter sp.]
MTEQNNLCIMETAPGYLVAIGASAGGFNAVFELVSHLRPETDAAYLIVLHLSSRSIGAYLAHRIQDHTKLKSIVAMDGMPLQKGHIYVAQPNHHLTVSKNLIRIGNGPAENRWRPSIDVLFRSAAVHYTNRSIGIILTGLFNDGTAGMSAIKRCGGNTIVQDPNEAEYPELPLSVLNAMEVGHCIPLGEMANAIDMILAKPEEPQNQPPPDLSAEVDLYERIGTDIRAQKQIGEYTPYTCPECGGVLFRHDQDSILKFKCHTGHSYTVRDLLKEQSSELEASIWVAVRSLEQRKDLLLSLGEKYARSGINQFADDYHQKAEKLEQHIRHLKAILSSDLDLPMED